MILYILQINYTEQGLVKSIGYLAEEIEEIIFGFLIHVIKTRLHILFKKEKLFSIGKSFLLHNDKVTH